MNKLFEQLLAFKWRGISFPVSEMSVQLQQDKAEHKAWKRQGANIEGTGRQSLQFRASIPFRNGVTRGKGETWAVLYPTEYRRFLDAMADPTTGVLTHPELGDINCKPEGCETSYSATKRDGCDVTATWIETIDLTKPDSDGIGGTTPIGEVELTAASLDVNFPNIKALAPGLPKRITSFSDMVRAIGSIGDQSKLFIARAAGMVARLDYAAKSLQSSFAVSNDPVLHGALRSVIRMRNSTHDLAKNILNQGGTFVLFRVPQPTTLVGLAGMLGVELANVLPFNPQLVNRAVIPAGLTIRYKK